MKTQDAPAPEYMQGVFQYLEGLTKKRFYGLTVPLEQAKASALASVATGILSLSCVASDERETFKRHLIEAAYKKDVCGQFSLGCSGMPEQGTSTSTPILAAKIHV